MKDSRSPAFCTIALAQKGEEGEGVNEWGFLGGENILEFVVEKESWYSGHENPGTPSCHPEWGQYIVSCTNTGNYGGM
ncbi:MAG: hypothetical protein RR241_05560 [Raoultibacter sp.]